MFPKPKRVKDRDVLDETKSEPCILCGRPSDPEHIRSRGAGGDDTPDNLMSLCRTHHNERHQKGPVHMWDRYFAYRREVSGKGWTLRTLFGIRKLVRK